MRSAGSRRRSGEEQAPNFLGETRAGSSTMGVWIWAAFQLFSAHDALRTDRADLMRWPCLQGPDFGRQLVLDLKRRRLVWRPRVSGGRAPAALLRGQCS